MGGAGGGACRPPAGTCGPGRSVRLGCQLAPRRSPPVQKNPRHINAADGASGGGSGERRQHGSTARELDALGGAETTVPTGPQPQHPALGRVSRGSGVVGHRPAEPARTWRNWVPVFCRREFHRETDIASRDPTSGGGASGGLRQGEFNDAEGIALRRLGLSADPPEVFSSAILKSPPTTNINRG